MSKICITLCFIVFFLVSLSYAELVAYWSFDEGSGSFAGDTAGSVSDNGILHNGVAWTADGAVGGAIDLDGVDDYISVANSSEISLGSGDFSFSFWLRHDNFDRELIYNQRYSSASFIEIGTDAGKLGIQAKIGGAWKVRLFSNQILAAETLYHVAIVVDRDNIESSAIYFNGIEVTDRSAVGYLMTTANLSLNADLDIGRWSGGTGYNWDGMIDELRIYNHALSPGEVSSLYNGSAEATPIYPAGQHVDDVSRQVTLRWNVDSADYSYDVYLGSIELVKVASLESNTKMFDAGQLDWAKTYYWKVDLVDSSGNIFPGSIWSFTTVIPECNKQLAGDVDGDCIVTVGDLFLLAQSWLDCNLRSESCP